MENIIPNEGNENGNENELNNLFHCIKVNNCLFKNYLSQVFHDLASRSLSQGMISLHTFHCFMALPAIISGKLFNSFKVTDGISVSDIDKLNDEEFTSGLFFLYNGSVRERRELLFKFLDFNNDGYVELDDIFLIFAHFHFFNNITLISQFEKFFDVSIRANFQQIGRKRVTLDEFLQLSSLGDIILILIFNFIKFMPFNSACVERHCLYFLTKNEMSVSSACEREDIFQYLPLPSKEGICYIEDNFNLRLINNNRNKEEETEEEALSSLDYFSQDLSKLICRFSVDSQSNNILMPNSKRHFSQDELDTLNENNYSKKKIYSFPKIKISESGPVQYAKSTGTTSFFSKCDSSDLKFEANSSENFIVSIPGEIKSSANEITALSSLHSNVLSKLKLILFLNHLFLFKFSTKKNDFVYESFIVLKNSYVELCQYESIKGVSYSAFKIYSDFHSAYAVKFLVAKDTPFIEFIQLMRKAMKYRSFHDYYEIGDQIGSGQFGRIFKAKNKISRQIVAVKNIRKKKPSEKSSNVGSCESANEIDCFYFLKSGNDPSLVKAIDLFETFSSLFIVYEHISGKNLHQIIDKLSDGEKEKIICDIMNAIGYLHKYGIVHRDIKPANVMCVHSDNSVCIKIIDFGFAKVLGKEDKLTEHCGTPMYMAPEIAQSRFAYNRKVDVWSFGVMIVHVILGSLSYVNNVALINEKNECTYESLFKKYYDIITSCIQENPKNRLDFSELIETIESIQRNTNKIMIQTKQSV